MGRKKGSKNKQSDAEKSCEVLSVNFQEVYSDSIASEIEVINTEIIANAIDNLLQAELAKLEGMKEPMKSSTASNLKKYYDAQRKAKE